MSDQRDLEGLSALVTGATSGIGKAAAEELGRHGAEIVVHGRDAGRGSAVAGTITAASNPMMTRTTMISIRVKPRVRAYPRLRCLLTSRRMSFIRGARGRPGRRWESGSDHNKWGALTL